MRRVIPLVILVLAVYSTVTMAQGGNNVYAPIVYGQALDPDAPLPLPNGDFEQGATVWSASSGVGVLPIQRYPDELAAPAYEGNWAARLGVATRDEVWQSVTVPKDRPVLAFYARVYSDDAVCESDVALVSVHNIRVYFPLCRTYADIGWRQHTLDLTRYAGETIQVSARNYTERDSELWIDDFAWTAP